MSSLYAFRLGAALALVTLTLSACQGDDNTLPLPPDASAADAHSDSSVLHESGADALEPSDAHGADGAADAHSADAEVDAQSGDGGGADAQASDAAGADADAGAPDASEAASDAGDAAPADSAAD